MCNIYTGHICSFQHWALPSSFKCWLGETALLPWEAQLQIPVPLTQGSLNATLAAVSQHETNAGLSVAADCWAGCLLYHDCELHRHQHDLVHTSGQKVT